MSDDSEKKLLEQPYSAYMYNLGFIKLHQKEVDALNGLVVPDAFQENSADMSAISDIHSQRVKDIVMKQRRSIKCHSRYLKAKRLS